MSFFVVVVVWDVVGQVSVTVRCYNNGKPKIPIRNKLHASSFDTF